MQDRAGDWQTNITLATAANRGQQLLNKKYFVGSEKLLSLCTELSAEMYDAIVDGANWRADR